MKNSNIIIIIIIAIIIIIGLWWYFSMPLATQMNNNATTTEQSASTTDQGVMVGGTTMLPTQNIVENVMGAANLTTLVSLIEIAGLSDVLQSESAAPFTVFAPTNDAFEKLPDGTVANLMKPENKDQLVSLLKYHVVSGLYTSADLEDGMRLKTLNGKDIVITKDASGNWVVNGKATVQTADVISSNGVLFVIDGVLMPDQVATSTATTTEE